MRQQQRDYPSPAELTPDGNSEPPNPKVHSDVEGRVIMGCPATRDSEGDDR